LRRIFGRRVLTIVILVGVLAALIALDRAAANWRVVVAGDAGALLYVATFEGGADGFNADWEQYEGRVAAAISDGRLQFEIDEPNGAPFSLPPFTYADVDVQTRASAIGGDIADNSFGIIFRMQDADNHYRFLISSDGFYSVVRTVNGEQKDLSTWIPSDAIRQGMDTPNDLRVIARGGTLAFFINDQRVQVCVPDDPDGESTYSGGTCYGTMRDELTDTMLTTGRVGVTAESLNLGSVVRIAFEDFMVFQPEAAS
jgi:hypothetical protein